VTVGTLMNFWITATNCRTNTKRQHWKHVP